MNVINKNQTNDLKTSKISPSIRSDIRKVLIIGSGPIMIGQACEFDYSGTQACKALMAEGLEVILVNSNPATIMTDPEIATKVYIEPLKPEFIEKIIETEKPDSLIPTLGGQTALNLALELDHLGILEKYSVKLLGANPEVIRAAEDRESFRNVLDKVGAKYPASELVRNFEQGIEVGDRIGYPIILRPNYTLGGGGGGIAYSPEEYKRMLVQALHESPTSEVLVEESILGWKEFELEVMRDRSGTFVVICTIENFDPCGVHTGDSITVAPIQTLSDYEYQEMRDEACKIINEIGVQTGGANIQFATHPVTKERVVIEMNPRVSRSSALASKATGFPIAKIAALLAVGYTLDEIKNDITKVTPSCYEPALDYVVTKIPRFAFEKFHGSKDLLSTQMKSVGEVMGIGRTFQESFMKAVSSLERNPEGFPEIAYQTEKISYPNSERLFHLYQSMRQGLTVEQLFEMTQITPWFLEQLADLVNFENDLSNQFFSTEIILKAKRKGFSDALIARLTKKTIGEVIKFRESEKMFPLFCQVDTCAGEFKSETPYYYSTYWYDWKNKIQLKQNNPISNKKIVEKYSTSNSPVAVIGSGPNRIGQGIEFDYSCVRGVKSFQKNGYPVLMVNSNPETVSTDYDTSDILFFEPLTVEHINEVFRFVKPMGFVAQLGGQTPISVAHDLVEKGFRLLGSDLKAIDLAEDRSQFAKICKQLKIQIPQAASVSFLQEAIEAADKIGYPVICRPSYVLGGRRMEVIESEPELVSYFERYQEFFSKQKPCFMDQFLEGALEVDVDLVRGVDWVLIGGVVEHIEAAGVHSGDSMGVIPPQRLKEETNKIIQELSIQLANELNVIGHLNLQLAIKNDEIFILEANPRSSRSVPFIVKATGIPLIDLGVQAMLGAKKEQVKSSFKDWQNMELVAVKGVVFPFKKFPESDSLLGPEMKSTGESMGRGTTYGEALMKAFISSGVKLPKQGEVFLSLRDKDKETLMPLVKGLSQMGYTLSATSGTAKFYNEKGFKTLALRKVHEGRPHCVDHIRSGNVSLVINTTRGKNSIEASFNIRRACTDYSIPCITESDTAEALLLALQKLKEGTISVSAL